MAWRHRYAENTISWLGTGRYRCGNHKELPGEPTFRSADFMAECRRLPLWYRLHVREYVTPETTRALFSKLASRGLVIINARTTNTRQYRRVFRALREGVNWIQQQHQ